jgi:hypothetical protein
MAITMDIGTEAVKVMEITTIAMMITRIIMAAGIQLVDQEALQKTQGIKLLLNVMRTA